MVSVKPEKEKMGELSRIVTPETYKDIEHYLKPQFKSRVGSGELDKDVLGTLQHKLPREERKITVDGYGKWREVRGGTREGKRTPGNTNDKDRSSLSSRASSHSCPSSRPHSHTSSRASSHQSQEQEELNSRRSQLQEEDDTTGQTLSTTELRDRHFIYNDLSMALRSNLFPGAGAYGTWQSQSKAAYTVKPVEATSNRDAFYGMTTDALGKWAEANVYRERVMKNWEEYMNSKPKPGERK